MDSEKQRPQERSPTNAEFQDLLRRGGFNGCCRRLAREDISNPSPRLYSLIADSVGLAKKILDKVVR